MPYAVPSRPVNSSPAAGIWRNADAITPADNAAIGPYFRLYTGSGGNITIVPINSTTPVLLAATPPGTVIEVAFQGVNATGTVATGIVGFY